MTLTKESFEKKQLAEQKGELWAYYEYRENNRYIVVRIYRSAVAVDYYNGAINLEDSEDEITTNEVDAWEKALEIANRFYKKYEFTGQQ